MKKFSKILLEKETTDRKIRKEAETIYNKIIRIINSKKEKIQQYQEGFSLELGKIDPKYKKTGLIFQVGRISDKPGELAVFASPGALAGPVNNIPSINMFILPDKWDYLIALKEIKSDRSKVAFIHEYIHYYDWSNHPDAFEKESRISAMSYMKSSEKLNYYNSNPEFNAYYQTGIKCIELQLKELLKSKYKEYGIELAYKVFPIDINDFLHNNIDKYFHVPWLKALNFKNQKKFLKRLADYYIDLHERLSRTYNEGQKKLPKIKKFAKNADPKKFKNNQKKC